MEQMWTGFKSTNGEVDINGNIVLKASDGYALSLAVFEREHPRGYIQIIHGMEEHKERYEAFAEQLWQAGFTVVTSDMRGHGEHAPKLGFFKEKDGDRYLLSDQVQITAYIRERFQTEKVMILHIPWEPSLQGICFVPSHTVTQRWY